MERQVSSLELLEALADVYLGEQSGVLHATPGEGPPAWLYFDRGLLLAALGAGPDEDPGQHLVASGALAPEDLASVRGGDQDPLGALPDIVDEDALREALRHACTRVVRRLASCPTSNIAVQDEVAPPPLPESDVLFTVETILTGARHAAGFEEVGKTLASLESRVRLRRRRTVPLERLTLDTLHGFLLSRLDGSLTLSEALSGLPPDQEEPAARFLLGLALLGIAAFDPPLEEGRFRVRQLSSPVVSLRERKAREALEGLWTRLSRSGSPREVLNVPVEASTQNIRQAASALQKTLETARGFPRLSSEWQQEIQAIESRLAAAIQALQTTTAPAGEDSKEGGIDWQQVRARREYEKTETQVSLDKAEYDADSYYAKARQFFSTKDYHSCIEFCTQAIQLRENVARYHHLLGEARSMNPELRWQKRAEESFRQACELDPFNADYLVSLARLYKRQGLQLRARKQLKKALGIVPNHEEARREMDTL